MEQYITKHAETDPEYQYYLIGRMGKGEEGHALGFDLTYHEAVELAKQLQNTWRFVEIKFYRKPQTGQKMSKKLAMPSEGNVFIATYGSLRRGMQNFRVNERGNGVFVSRGQTVDQYDLYRYGGSYFPSVNLKANKSGLSVVVDVFEAPKEGLTGAYDMLEGYNPNSPEDGFYNRTQIEVKLDDGTFVNAWIYHIDEDQGDSNRVESGDWCLHNDANYYDTL